MRYPAARSFSLLLMLGALACAASAQDGPAEGLTVVSGIDIPRYMGTWYEVARLPNPFQKQCVGEVTATYTLRDDGEIDVVNRCRSATGEVSEAKGRARRADEEEPNSKLKVRFAPAFLSFLPFVWGDYWILELSPDCSYAVIGEPERKYLWILSRAPAMAESTLLPILARMTRQGYDCSALIRNGIIAGADSNRVSLAALERSANDFRDAYNRKDVDALAAMYAEDAFYVSPHVPNLTIRGREQIRENWRRGISTGGHIDTVEVLSGDLSGDLAYLVTAYQATNSGITVRGRNVLVMKRIRGKWLITTHASVVKD